MNKIADDDAYEMMINESLYREQLLEVFGLDKRGDFDDDHINKQIELLFHICKQYTPMMEIIEYVSERHPLRMMITDEDSMIVGFMVLFSYDLFFLTHQCIRYIFRAGNDEKKHADRAAEDAEETATAIGVSGASGNYVIYEINNPEYEPVSVVSSSATVAAASATSTDASSLFLSPDEPHVFRILKEHILKTM
jgi:hypothetical protein